MSPQRSDLNLLLGITALHLELITKEQLLESFQAWMSDKDTLITEIFQRRGYLTKEDQENLERLVNARLEDEAGDLYATLSSVPKLEQVCEELEKISDEELLRSLQETMDVYATQGYEEGQKAIGLRFLRIREHAKGGLGIVWLAKDRELNRVVAVKEIKEANANNQIDRVRFEVEGEITGGLEHPNIVPVYGMGKYSDGRPYYAMRFIRGVSLRDAIDEYHHQSSRKPNTDRNGQVELRRLLSRFIDVCHAMAYAHSRFVLHRDLKPDNIMLGKFGETLVVDWGLADAWADRLGNKYPENAPGDELDEKPLQPHSGSIPTIPGHPLGTIGFMSPEQARGEIESLGIATDIYSLGATLYQLLTGSPPIRASNLGEALRRIEASEFPKPSELNPRLSKPLEAICLKAMAKLPGDRYATAHHLAEDIERWMADDPISALPDSTWQSMQRWLRRHRTWAQAAVASLLIITVVMTASAFLINIYRQAQLKASRISEISARFDVALANKQQLDAAGLKTMHSYLSQLQELEGSIPDVKYTSLEDRFKNDLDKIIGEPNFDLIKKAHYDELVNSYGATFGDRANSAVKEWTRAGVERLRKWNVIFDATPESPENLPAAVRDNPQLTMLPDNKLGRSAKAAGSLDLPLVSIPVCEFRWTVGFDSSWASGPLVGMNITYTSPQSNQGPAPQYSFVLASLDANSSSIENRQLERVGPMSASMVDQNFIDVQMIILRNGSQLRHKRIRLPRSPLKMQCQRSNELLVFNVIPDEGDGEYIDCHDPFALTARPGKVGVICPASVTIRSLKLEQQSLPLRSSITEEADQHYNQGRFLEALSLYEKLPSSPETSYKLALTYSATNRESEYQTIIDELVAQSGDQGEENQWIVLAHLRKLASLARSDDKKNLRMALLNLEKLKIKSDMLAFLPQDEREAIFQELGKVGLRFRIVFDSDEDARFVEFRAAILNSFSEDDVARKNTLWRLADCYRVQGKHAEARQILDDLLQNRWRNQFETTSFELPLTSRDRRLLIYDQAWLIGAENEGNDPQAALAFIDEQMAATPMRDDSAHPLMVEQARLRLLLTQRAQQAGLTQEAQDNLSQAKSLLDRWLRSPPIDSTYMEIGQANLLRGQVVLYEAGPNRGDANIKEKANEFWKAALRRNWKNGPLIIAGAKQMLGAEGVLATNELAIDGAAISLYKQISDDEVERALKNYVPGTGLSKSIASSIVTKLVAPKGGTFGKLTANDFLKRVFTDLYDTPPGERMRERMILRNCSLKEFQHDPIYHILYRTLWLAGFQDEGFPKDVEPFIHEEIRSLVWLYDKPRREKNNDVLPANSEDDQRLEDTDFEKVLAMFNGNYTQKNWQTLQKKFGKQLSGSAAYVFGNIYKQLGQFEQAKAFLRFALDQPETIPAIATACRQDLQKLEAMQ